MKKILLPVLFIAIAICVQAQTKTGPKILVVTAHPDDETAMAAVIYKVTHEMNGTVDQCVITNGEGGYKYSTLAESYYNLELTDEKVGRENLPRIRKQELINAGKIIGTNNIFFLDQKDAHYGLDEHEPLDTTWNVPWVTARLKEIMTTTKYDFVFCLLPVPETHAHHKAATLLALRTVQSLPQTQRPIVLGVIGSTLKDSSTQEAQLLSYYFGATNASLKDTAVSPFYQLKNYTETKVEGKNAMYSFDKTVGFGYKNKLTYKIIVNWEIAEHKSQGTMQLAMNGGDYEIYWFFAMNDASGKEKCKTLFESLKKIPYKNKEY